MTHLLTTTTSLAIGLGLLQAPAAAAPAQQLVENINTAIQLGGSSNPGYFAATSGRLYFQATTPTTGTELFYVDGVGAAPVLLADLEAGADSSYPRAVVELPSGQVLFTASTAGEFRTAVVSDGTSAGTVPLVKAPGGVFADVEYFELHQGEAYFFADDPLSSGYDLWKTDGTTAGTVLVEDFAGLSPMPAEYYALASSGGDLFFAVNYRVGFQTFWRLYRTDGVPGAAVQLADVPTGGNSSWIEMEATGNGVAFAADGAAQGREVWVSDGTPAGTQVAEVVPGADSAFPNYLTAVGSDVFFVASDPALGREVFKTDGTVAGTFRVTDIAPGPASASPTELVAGPGVLYFSASDGVHGQELWGTVGLVGSEFMLADLFPGPNGSFPDALTFFGSELYCSATIDFDTGTELVATDGGPAGVRVVADLQVGGSGDPRSIVEFAGALFFDGDGTFVGRELWSTDGTTAGTALVADLHPTVSDVGSEPAGLTRIGDRAVFAAEDGTKTSATLYTTDGTAAGTAAVDPDFAGSFDSGYTDAPFAGFTLGTRAFFAPEDAALGIELWVTDGTAGGTALLADLAPGDQSSYPSPLAVWRGEVYFSAGTPSLGRELYATDGTAAGTRLVSDVAPGPDTGVLGGGVVHDGRLYFHGHTAAGGSELWRTDGTGAGTEQVIDLFPGSSSGLVVFSAASLGDHLYFHGQASPAASELYRTDGTAAGTTLFADINPAGGSAPLHLRALDDRLVFSAYSNLQRQLWGTDGVAVEQLTAQPLAVGVLTFEPFDNGSVVLMVMNKGLNDRVLVATDGTAAGTAEIGPIAPAWESVQTITTWRETSGPHVLFLAYEQATGDELWVTDGTAAGTVRLTDVVPGTGDSGIKSLTRVGGNLLFGAVGDGIGVELFSLPIASYGGWVAEPFGLGCAGSSGQAPAIGASGSATLGGTLSVDLTDAAPSSVVGHYFSPAFAPSQLGTCELYLAAPSLIATAGTDGGGAAALPLAIPTDPALAGAQLWLQSVVIDPGGTLFGFGALSPALEVVLAP